MVYAHKIVRMVRGAHATADGEIPPLRERL
jgi:hypothetical protein